MLHVVNTSDLITATTYCDLVVNLDRGTRTGVAILGDLGP